jgi:hypothetical protein
MMRNWHTFVLPAFVTVALGTPALMAGEPGPKTDRLKPLQDKLDKLQESLKADFKQIAADIKDLKDDIKSVRNDHTNWQLRVQGQIADLKTDLDALKKRLPSDVALYPPADKAGMEEIRSKLAQIEHILGRLQAQQTRVSLSPPAGSGPTGRLLLVNSYPTEILFVVNGQSHRVAPGATMALDVAAGSVSYEAIAPAWGVVRQNTTTLAANETLSLVVR